jgi:hypothetical protein
LALGVVAVVTQDPMTDPGGDVIIIKGGSISIECNHGCLEYKGGGKFGHKENGKPGDYRKIVKIVIKDEDGKVLGSFDKKHDFKGGKPTIEIAYRTPKPEDN